MSIIIHSLHKKMLGNVMLFTFLNSISMLQQLKPDHKGIEFMYAALSACIPLYDIWIAIIFYQWSIMMLSMASLIYELNVFEVVPYHQSVYFHTISIMIHHVVIALYKV